ncbi:MAG: metal-dependent hydrolase, partial [Planctomycetota bacterium]
MELTWLGHGGWSIKTASHTILLDPFLTDSPTAPCKADELAADFILVSHGHFDHIADVPEIAKRTGAEVVAVYEVTSWLQSVHGIDHCVGANIGGTVTLPFGKVTLTHAIHSSQLPDGSYGGNPAGFVVAADDRRVYFACDTALFSDMQLLADPPLDLAVLPIG